MFQDLQTKRLLLRRLRPDDAPAVFRYRSDPEVYRFQVWTPANQEEIAGFIEAQERLEPDSPGTWFQLGVELRASGELIGDVGMHFPPETPGQTEIGMTIDPAHQRKGYATEAARTVLVYLFRTLRKRRVTARTDPRNAASIGLLERIGMRRECLLRGSTLMRGELADDLVYTLSAETWLSKGDLARESE